MGDPKPDVNDKADLRREMRRRRLALADRVDRSAVIWSHVVAVAEVTAATRILVFSSIPGEPETRPFIDWAASYGKLTAVPEDGVDPTWPDVVIVPGVAFTSDGHRLGQGGGWYDRFLADVRPDCLTIGVGFTEQIVATIPTEPHDITLDRVITDIRGGRDVTLFDLDELDAAISVVRRHMAPTPLYSWPLLDEVVGSPVLVKHENHTPVGAFKVRGGLVYLDRLARERPDVSGVVSATRGNHGQSLAFAAREYGRTATIFVPHGNSVEKNAAMRALGAEVIEWGDDFQEARERSLEYAGEHGLEPVPPFHRDLVIGVATYARELFDQVGSDNPLDTVYVPVGMGSGINALIAVRDLLGVDTEIVGVVSELAPSTLRSFERGVVVTTPNAATFVDGVATRSPDPTAIAGIVAGAARVIAVSDGATAAAMRTVFSATHNVAESAGAIALAGLWSEPVDLRGERCAFVLTGGNVDAAQLHAVLGGATPAA